MKHFGFQISNKHEPVDPALISEYIALGHINQYSINPFKIQNYHQMFQLLRYFLHLSIINTKLQPTADSSDQKYIDGPLRQGDLHIFHAFSLCKNSWDQVKEPFFRSFESEKAENIRSIHNSFSFFILFFLRSPHGLHMRKPKSSKYKRKAFQNSSLQRLQLYPI